MSDEQVIKLYDYAVTSIVQVSDCVECYDVTLSPNQRPKVYARIRAEDLIKLASAMQTKGKTTWELDTDKGSLFIENQDVLNLVSVEVQGQDLHFYGLKRGKDYEKY